MSSIVKLNVGGTVFVTSKSTLTRFEGFFRTLLETNVGLEKDDAGCIFIDRSPKHFDLILNFMRDGDVEITKDHKQVMAEAQYYLLGELIDLCKTSMQPGHLLPNTLPLIESDKQYLHILANQTKPIIIIHYNISEWHSMPPMFNPFEFLEKYSDKYDIYFKKADDEERKEWSAFMQMNVGERKIFRDLAPRQEWCFASGKLHRSIGTHDFSL